MALVTGGRFSEIANMQRDDFYLGDNKIHLPGTKQKHQIVLSLLIQIR